MNTGATSKVAPTSMKSPHSGRANQKQSKPDIGSGEPPGWGDTVGDSMISLLSASHTNPPSVVQHFFWNQRGQPRETL
jgi:hypothetical protein